MQIPTGSMQRTPEIHLSDTPHVSIDHHAMRRQPLISRASNSYSLGPDRSQSNFTPSSDGSRSATPLQLAGLDSGSSRSQSRTSDPNPSRTPNSIRNKTPNSSRSRSLDLNRNRTPGSSTIGARTPRCTLVNGWECASAVMRICYSFFRPVGCQQGTVFRTTRVSLLSGTSRRGPTSCRSNYIVAITEFRNRRLCVRVIRIFRVSRNIRLIKVTTTSGDSRVSGISKN